LSLKEAAKMAAKGLPGVPPKNLSAHARKVKRVVILHTLWYEDIMGQLVSSAQDYLKAVGIEESAIEVYPIPGSYELPLAAKHFIKAKKPDFVVALGCVIRGETPHFDFICQSTTQGLMDVSLEKKTPIGFGVLTVNTLAQARARASKGLEAAQAAFFMSYWLGRR
jgi:6,7-dimethyl-8-ribityllumazine synthase